MLNLYDEAEETEECDNRDLNDLNVAGKQSVEATCDKSHEESVKREIYAVATENGSTEHLDPLTEDKRDNDSNRSCDAAHHHVLKEHGADSTGHAEKVYGIACCKNECKTG